MPTPCSNASIAGRRAAGVPVIYVQHETREGAMASASLAWTWIYGSRRRPATGSACKTTPDSFLRTTLSDELEAAGASRVVICGYATEFCVDTTVRRAAGWAFP